MIKGVLGSPASESRWSCTALALFSPISMPLSLIFPVVPHLLQCRFHHVANFPKICSGLVYYYKTIKPNLSVGSRLAYQWPLQNLCAPISVMNTVPTLTLCCPCTLVFSVCLTQSLKCRPTFLPVPLPKCFSSYIYSNCPAPLLSSLTAVAVLRVILDQQQQQQHLLSTCGNADSGGPLLPS